jgi:hypothetical protein
MPGADRKDTNATPTEEAGTGAAVNLPSAEGLGSIKTFGDSDPERYFDIQAENTEQIANLLARGGLGHVKPDEINPDVKKRLDAILKALAKHEFNRPER